MSSRVKRLFNRKKIESPVQVISEMPQEPENHAYCYSQARIFNIDKGGMYFEIMKEIEVGSNVCLKMTDDHYTTDKSNVDKVHYARVKWCKKINRPKDVLYGIGVQIYDTVIQAEIC